MTQPRCTMNYDNWKTHIRHECTSKIHSYTRKGADWHCYHCARRPHVKLDDVRKIMGPCDKNGQVHTFEVCDYYKCPAIGHGGE